jgi:hypothetical protein
MFKSDAETNRGFPVAFNSQFDDHLIRHSRFRDKDGMDLLARLAVRLLQKGSI